MRSYVKRNRETIFPLGIASAVMSIIIAAAVMFSEISPSAIF